MHNLCSIPPAGDNGPTDTMKKLLLGATKSYSVSRKLWVIPEKMRVLYMLQEGAGTLPQALCLRRLLSPKPFSPKLTGFIDNAVHVVIAETGIWRSCTFFLVLLLLVLFVLVAGLERLCRKP